MEKEQILSDFGCTLNRIRTESGLSQEKLADIAELDRTYVSSVERGQRNLSLINICKLAIALGCTPMSLLEGLGEES